MSCKQISADHYWPRNYRARADRLDQRCDFAKWRRQIRRRVSFSLPNSKPPAAASEVIVGNRPPEKGFGSQSCCGPKIDINQSAQLTAWAARSCFGVDSKANFPSRRPSNCPTTSRLMDERLPACSSRCAHRKKRRIQRSSGIGINVNQALEDFPKELRDPGQFRWPMALGRQVDRQKFAIVASA